VYVRFPGVTPSGTFKSTKWISTIPLGKHSIWDKFSLISFSFESVTVGVKVNVVVGVNVGVSDGSTCTVISVVAVAVSVGGTSVAVGGTSVAVGGTLVAVGGTFVAVGLGSDGVLVGFGVLVGLGVFVGSSPWYEPPKVWKEFPLFSSFSSVGSGDSDV